MNSLTPIIADCAHPAAASASPPFGSEAVAQPHRLRTSGDASLAPLPLARGVGGGPVTAGDTAVVLRQAQDERGALSCFASSAGAHIRSLGFPPRRALRALACPSTSSGRAARFIAHPVSVGAAA